MTTLIQEELTEQLNVHNEEKSRLEMLHNSTIDSLKSKMTEHEEKLKSLHLEEKSSLESKIADLDSHVKYLEVNLNSGSDYRVKTAHGKIVNLEQEVESLKTVLEMKTSEVHELRTDKVKLEEKLELYDQQQLTLRKMSAQVNKYNARQNCLHRTQGFIKRRRSFSFIFYFKDHHNLSTDEQTTSMMKFSSPILTLD